MTRKEILDKFEQELSFHSDDELNYLSIDDFFDEIRYLLKVSQEKYFEKLEKKEYYEDFDDGDDDENCEIPF